MDMRVCVSFVCMQYELPNGWSFDSSISYLDHNIVSYSDVSQSLCLSHALSISERVMSSGRTYYKRCGRSIWDEERERESDTEFVVADGTTTVSVDFCCCCYFVCCSHHRAFVCCCSDSMRKYVWTSEQHERTNSIKMHVPLYAHGKGPHWKWWKPYELRCEFAHHTCQTYFWLAVTGHGDDMRFQNMCGPCLFTLSM